MPSSISLEGIDLAIAHLNYRNVHAPKYKLIHAIRRYYDSADAIRKLRRIDTAELIRLIWDLGDDPDLIKSKRKNFNSIRSTVNADLLNLYRDDKNPEGIAISADNIFEMSDSAKDELLSSFSDAVQSGGGASLKKISEVLGLLNELLTEPQKLTETDSRDELLRIAELVKGLSQKVVGDGGADVRPGESPSGQTDDLETVDEDEIVEVDEDLVETLEEEAAADAPADDLETVDEDEIVEVDEDLETVDEDEIVEVDEWPPGDLGAEVGMPFGPADEHRPEPDDDLLSEQFDGYLGAMERYYNQYIHVPAGEYTIGRKRPHTNELPLQQVYLPGFYMGKYPVTNALFEVFVEKTGYVTTAEKRGWGIVYVGRFRNDRDPKTGKRKSLWNTSTQKNQVQGAFWYQPAGPGSTLHHKRNHPVVQVSLADARAFAAWTGKRLPGELEWEAAMRSDSAFVYPWGNEWREKNCNTEKSAVADTTPVDRYPEGLNSFGIADAIGNVLEWTADETKTPFAAVRKAVYHSVRGGSWISGDEVTLLTRFRFEVTYTSNILGFRCVAD
ncbi:MAG: formylglycine-generating enzyme family protein [Thermodesulfobacteriota bacterium]